MSPSRRPRDGLSPDSARDDWLDVIRAAAISSVVPYHLSKMTPGTPWGGAIVQQGHLGVDLFFVLSGWLIGGLYWRERKSDGAVDLWRFWLRRWWRTVPPYLLALALSWLAVWFDRRQPFEPGYLLFLQNYYTRIPYFVVSWSLCIEEHFYVVVPLVVSLALRLRVRIDVLFAGLAVTSFALRWFAMDKGFNGDFGFYQTGTHFRLDGLVLGFWVSRVSILQPSVLVRARRLARWLLPATIALLLWSLTTAAQLRYLWLPLSAPLCALALLLCGVGTALPRNVASKAILLIAKWSYSLYLTHVLVLHVARFIAQRGSASSAPITYHLVAPPLIILVGAAFFFLAERPSLRLREHLAPARTSSRVDAPNLSQTRPYTEPSERAKDAE